MVCQRQVIPFAKDGAAVFDMNNLKLIIQPYLFYCLIRPGLEGFNLTIVGLGLGKLIHYLNEFRTLVNEGVVMDLVTLRAC